MLSIPHLPDSLGEGPEQQLPAENPISPQAVSTPSSGGNAVRPGKPSQSRAASGSAKKSNGFKTRLQQPKRHYQSSTTSYQQRVTPKAHAQRAQDSRLPATKSSSVFDRLYKTQTAASKAWTPARTQARKTAAAATASSSDGNVDDTLQVFSRLHITSTVSQTRRHKMTPKHPPRKSPSRSPHSGSSSAGSGGPTFPSPISGRTRTGAMVYSPRMKPKTKLFFNSRYHPGLGLETVEPISLGYSFFQCFCDYEMGRFSAKDLAFELIVSFFKKDFPGER